MLAVQTPRRPRYLRKALVAVAASALVLSSVSESLAQRFGGFSMGRGSMGSGISMGGGSRMQSMSMTNRIRGDRVRGVGNRGGDRITGGGDRYPPRGPHGPRGPRYPGGPGILIVPGGYGPPGGPVVVVEDDEPGPRYRRNAQKQKKNNPPPQQVAQSPRGGFNAPPPGENRFVQNEVLLNFPGTVTAPALDALARRHRLTRLEQRDYTLTQRRLVRLRINDQRPVATVIRSLQAEASVLSAQPNYLYTVQQGAAPRAADPMQYSFSKMRLTEAQAVTKGNGVLVAVIDTRIDTAHPDLAGVVTGSFDATGAPDKPHAHGTGIAGVIAAQGKLIGVAPSVKLLAVQAFASAKSEGTSMHILDALEWSGKAGAKVINMSFAGPADAEVHTMILAVRNTGAVLIAAAGNAGPKSKPLYPAAYPETIAVTATDIEDKLFAQANRGRHISVAAPGVSILAPAPGEAYTMQSGTSFAAAQISGVAALILERNPSLDAAAVQRILMSTARDLGPVGTDDQFGAGLADAYSAVMSAAPVSIPVSKTTPAPVAPVANDVPNAAPTAQAPPAPTEVSSAAPAPAAVSGN